MAKPGRNDPCPCGSGNKYKKCCLAKDEAAFLAQLGSAKTREELTEDAARRALRTIPHLPGIHELKTAIAARRGMSEDNLQRYDQLIDASDAVVDLVRSAKLDAAEVAARDLLARFPDQPDGWDRLGMVYEARGDANAEPRQRHGLGQGRRLAEAGRRRGRPRRGDRRDRDGQDDHRDGVARLRHARGDRRRCRKRACRRRGHRVSRGRLT